MRPTSVPPSKRSWKEEVKAVERKRTTGPGWRREILSAAPRQRQGRRQIEIGVAGFAFLTGVGLLIWLISWLWPVRPACLVLIGAGYEDNLAFPVNVYGMNGLDNLARLTEEQPSSFWESGLLRLQQQPRRLRVGDAWDQKLDRSSERTIVVFFALHGGSDGQGAYLLPDDADTGDVPENRLRVDQILDRLSQLPASQNKVLILDAAQMEVNWPLGMLENEFARALERLEPRIAAIPNLVVFSSSGPGQRSWASDEWRQTVFTHFLLEGLQGAAADGHSPRINLWQVYQYVHTHVSGWAWACRQSWQTPTLLPRGDLGRQRAAVIELALARPFRPANPLDLPVFQVPSELTEAWSRHQRLAEQAPPPAAYSPALWRLYQALLLRYEQLLIAQAPAAAEQVSRRLREVEEQIGRHNQVEIRALQNSLVLPAVAGVNTAAPDAQVTHQFTQLWNSRPEDFAAQWAKLLAGSNLKTPIATRVLRLQMLDLLLDRAAEDPGNNLARAGVLARVLADPVYPKPAEIHYLVMLRRDLPDPPPPADLLKIGLRNIDRAQMAAFGMDSEGYPYSEEVFSWIQALITTGDRDRRVGEDLLFASEASSWNQAFAAFERARKVYVQAQADAGLVRNALVTRNRALAEVPYFSRWLARRRRIVPAQSGPALSVRVAEVESLWNKTHQLTRLLNQAPRDGKDDQATLQRLAQNADDVRQPLDKLGNHFLQVCLALTDVNLQIVWRDIDDVLAVPHMQPGLRVQLITNRQRISRYLLIETAQGTRSTLEPDPKAATEHAKTAGRLQGRLALAELGRSWFDQCMSAGAETYEQTQHRLETFTVEERWWESLDKVGEAVGHCWRQMPVEIDRQLRRGKGSDLSEALTAFQTADALARLIDAGDGRQLTGSPSDLLRRLRIRDLLGWQAKRTWEDHWFAEDPRAEPYYRVAGLLYLQDAQATDPRERPKDAGLQKLRAELSGPGSLMFQGQSRADMTSQRQLDLNYELEPVSGAMVPPGAPVVWVEAGKGLQLREPATGTRLLRHVGADRAAAAVLCRMSSPLLQQAEREPPAVPMAEPSSVRLRGLYRGQQIERNTRIDLYPLADTIVHQEPLPFRGDIAVRAAPAIINRFGTGNGAVAIVLDCSGSMGPPPGQAYGPQTKYAEALTALRSVLARIPKGTTVSLWVFGQAIGPRKTVEQAERTVQRVQSPIVWDPDDPAMLRSLMARVQYPTLEPWNESPIVRAMVSAKNDLANASGFKTLLVLTDGMDNRFAGDRELNPNKLSIPAFLTETFRDSGIVVNMVGYKVVDREQKKAEEQFKVVEKLPLPGKFVTVNEARQLAATLDLSLRQSLRYWVDSEVNVPLSAALAGVEVTPLGANNQWYPGGLNPGAYKVRVQTNRRLEKGVVIGSGDLLLVNLVPTDRGTVFERALFSRSAYPAKPARDKSGWRLAVLQNQAAASGGLEMLLTLEKTFDPREDVLQMIKPRRIWIEVQPFGGTRSLYCQRWGYLQGYPAPAWSFRIPSWPPPSGGGGPARPLVRVWWDPDQESRPASSLERGADFRLPRDIVNRPIRVAGDEIRVNGVSVEEHLVEVRPGIRETRSCLVVRLSHAADRPVMVRPRGLAPAGQEHRFYSQASQYTGLFWPVTPDEANEALQAVDLFSLTVLKRNAEQRGFAIEMNDLGAPDPGDIRPRQPLSGN